MTETQRRSADRFNKRNRLAGAKNRPGLFTPKGNALACDLIGALADFLAGKLDVKPDKPPPFLRKAVRELLQEKDGPLYLALAALAPLLDGISQDWGRRDRSVEGKLKLKAGEDLYRRLRQDRVANLKAHAAPWQLWQAWSTKQKVNAGNWLLRQAIASYMATASSCSAVLTASDCRWKTWLASRAMRCGGQTNEPMVSPLQRLDQPSEGAEAFR